MIAMSSYMSVQSGPASEVKVSYTPARPSDVGELPARIYVELKGKTGHVYAGLTIEHARTLAEELPRLIMAHDAAEHAAKEHAAAVAESQAA
ncbi:hypothetical protein ACWF9G_19685 [Nocardia sp. NPDC055029]